MITTVYIALALTHVRTDAEKEEIRSFLKWLKEKFKIEILTWAFDTETWMPKPVGNVYLFDGDRVTSADLVIFLYLSSEGSDGRGAEMLIRVISGKPFVVFAKKGIKMSRFPEDCFKHHEVDITRFDDFDDMEPSIRHALIKINKESTVRQKTLFKGW